MYSVSADAAQRWRALLAAIGTAAGVPLTWLEHAAPEPIDALWQRPDLGAVFMCGLPVSLATPPLRLVAAPVPLPAAYGGEARYWSKFVVRRDSMHRTVADTFGGALALTEPESQSGCVAALTFFQTEHPGRLPLYREVIAPTVTPVGAMLAVVHGAADIAPIDSFAFDLMTRFRTDLTDQVRVVGETVPTPIPPLVAAPHDDWPAHRALQAALLDAHRVAATKSLLDSLLLERFILPRASAYAILSERYAAARAYWSSRPLATILHPRFAQSAKAASSGDLTVK